jgi:hypothetical protein
MKVTPKTNGAYTSLYEYDMTVTVYYSPASYDPVARVVEFPKVWREYGTQYKVRDCHYEHNGNDDDHVTIRVPRGVYAYGCNCDDTIEEY